MPCHLRKTRRHISSQDSPLTTLYNKTNLSLMCFFTFLLEPFLQLRDTPSISLVFFSGNSKQDFNRYQFQWFNPRSNWFKLNKCSSIIPIFCQCLWKIDEYLTISIPFKQIYKCFRESGLPHMKNTQESARIQLNIIRWFHLVTRDWEYTSYFMVTVTFFSNSHQNT